MDAEKIKHFPVIFAKDGNKTRCGYLDKENGLLYLMDDNDEPTGESLPVNEVKKETPAHPTSLLEMQPEEMKEYLNDNGFGKEAYVKNKKQRSIAKDEEEPFLIEKCASSVKKKLSSVKKKKEKAQKEEKKKEAKQKEVKPNKSKNPVMWKIILINVLVSLLLVSSVFLYGNYRFHKMENVISSTSTESNDEVSSTFISVIGASRDLYPNTAITPDCLEEIEITQAEYDSLTKAGIHLCEYQNASFYMGLYINSYIAEGAYLQTGFISSSIYSTDLTNPWMAAASITAPYSMSQGSLSCGDVVNVTFTRTVDADQVLPVSLYSGISGLMYNSEKIGEHVVEILTLQESAIADINYSDDSGLFNKCVITLDVPFGDLVSIALDLFDSENQPSEAVIACTQQQYDCLNTFMAQPLDSVEYSKTGKVNASTELAQRIIEQKKTIDSILGG